MSGAARRVARGAALLDEHEPGWADRIELDTLQTSNGFRCTLGQLHGVYIRGLKLLNLTSRQGQALGFNCYGVGFVCRCDRLDPLWRDAVLARSAPEVEP